MGKLIGIYLMCWRKPLRLCGRADRREFWTACLVHALVVTGAAVLLCLAGVSELLGAGLGVMCAVIAVFPLFAVAARRLHDCDVSAWLLGPFVVFLLIWASIAGLGQCVFLRGCALGWLGIVLLPLFLRKGKAGRTWFDPFQDVGVTGTIADTFVLEIERLAGDAGTVHVVIDGRPFAEMRRNDVLTCRLPRKTVSVLFEARRNELREVLVKPVDDLEVVRLQVSVVRFRLAYLMVAPLLAEFMRPWSVRIVSRQYRACVGIAEKDRIDLGRDRSRYDGRSMVSKVLVVLTYVLTVHIFLAVRSADYVRMFGDVGWVGLVMYMIFSVPFLPMALYVIANRLRRCRECPSVDLRGPYILYLRSFLADRTTSRSVDVCSNLGLSEEEVLVDELSDVAPVVAIGDPSDRYMPFGAARYYVSDAEWKSRVDELARHAEFVVLRIGETDSFMWEVSHCLETVSRSRIIFLMPREGLSSRSLKRLEGLLRDVPGFGDAADKCQRAVTCRGKGSLSGCIRFDADGAYATPVEFPRFPWRRTYRESIRQMLSGLLWAAGARYNNLFTPDRFRERNRMVRFCFVLVVSLLVMAVDVIQGLTRWKEGADASEKIREGVHAGLPIAPSDCVWLGSSLCVPQPEAAFKTSVGVVGTGQLCDQGTRKGAMYMWGSAPGQKFFNADCSIYVCVNEELKHVCDQYAFDEFAASFCQMVATNTTVLRKDGGILVATIPHADGRRETWANFLVDGHLLTAGSVVPEGRQRVDVHVDYLCRWAVSIRTASRHERWRKMRGMGDSLTFQGRLIPPPEGCVSVYLNAFLLKQEEEAESQVDSAWLLCGRYAARDFVYLGKETDGHVIKYSLLAFRRCLNGAKSKLVFSKLKEGVMTTAKDQGSELFCDNPDVIGFETVKTGSENGVGVPVRELEMLFECGGNVYSLSSVAVADDDKSLKKCKSEQRAAILKWQAELVRALGGVR